MEDFKEIELQDEEIDQMLSRPPSWMLRWGTWMAMAVILLLLALGWFIKYSDTVAGSFNLSGNASCRGIVSGVIIISDFNSNNIEIGQKVVLNFADFPSIEYGLVAAKVDSVLTVPEKSAKKIYFSFFKGIRSAKNRTIPYCEGMTGSSKILTKKKRFLEWIF